MIGRDLISIRDLSDAGIFGLFALADEFAPRTRERQTLAQHAVMAALFYEPSTRTRMSFEAAMLRLGGQVIAMTDPAVTSAAKGETLADTVRIIEGYTDVIVLRHPYEGAAQMTADLVGVPVINAGDGAREHPTQTLLDLYTIYRETGRLHNVTVAMCGDLKYGRTVHSLVQGLARFGARILCIAPEGLALPERFTRGLREQYGTEIRHYTAFDEAPLQECDALYVTRLQRERFPDREAFERVRASYQVTRVTLERVRRNAIVLHPLPRVDELDYALDGDPRAAYFRQAAYGVPVRMALVAALLGQRTVDELFAPQEPWMPCATDTPFLCRNPRCITTIEPGIAPRGVVNVDGARRCAYCEYQLEAACPVVPPC